MRNMITVPMPLSESEDENEEEDASPSSSSAPSSSSLRWVAKVDKISKETFYFCAATGKSTWVKPDSLALDIPKKGESSTWELRLDPYSKYTYWYDTLSGETSWSRPAGAGAIDDDDGAKEWNKHYDKKSGREYYFNKNSRLVSWVRPADISTCWEEHHDPKTGRRYFFNTATRQRSWSKPARFDEEKRRKATAEKAQAAAKSRSDWVRTTHARSGTDFYAHRVTGERCWILPEARALMPERDVHVRRQWQLRLHEHYLINRPMDAWGEVERAWGGYQRTLRESRALLTDAEVRAVTASHRTQVTSWQKMCRDAAEQSAAMRGARRRARAAAARAAAKHETARRLARGDDVASSSAQRDNTLTTFVSSMLSLGGDEDEDGDDSGAIDELLLRPRRPKVQLPDSAFRARFQ